MKSPEWTNVTWYSKLGTIVFLLLCVPTLSFYIGKSYQNVIQLAEHPTDEVYTTTSNWTKLNLREDESNQLFKSVREYIKKNDEKLIYSELVLDKRNKDWILMKVNPEINGDFISTQVYLKKQNGAWQVMGVGTVPTKLCNEYPELGC